MTDDTGASTQETGDSSADRSGTPMDPSLPDPLLPDQPVDAERPMPLRAAPERASDPTDWHVATQESVPSRAPDGPPPEAGVDLRDHAPDGVEEESSYSTELGQGAVHPQGSVDRDDAGDEA